jgi:hypothetical protein
LVFPFQGIDETPIEIFTRKIRHAMRIQHSVVIPIDLDKRNNELRAAEMEKESSTRLWHFQRADAARGGGFAQDTAHCEPGHCGGVDHRRPPHRSEVSGDDDQDLRPIAAFFQRCEQRAGDLLRRNQRFGPVAGDFNEWVIVAVDNAIRNDLQLPLQGIVRVAKPDEVPNARDCVRGTRRTRRECDAARKHAIVTVCNHRWDFVRIVTAITSVAVLVAEINPTLFRGSKPKEENGKQHLAIAIL